MVKKQNWDFALRIRGVTPRSIPLSRLADYLKEFAGLLGDGQRPVFSGIVRGSAVLRASVDPGSTQEARIRLLEAKSRVESSAVRHVDNIAKLMERDGASGRIEDRAGAVILELRPRKKEVDVAKEYLVQDTGILDGIVVGITGVDETAHIKLQGPAGATYSVVLRDIGMARQIAQYFRANAIRVHVHGTWKRLADGIWEPNILYGDHFEELDDATASEIFSELAKLPGIGWSSMDDPTAFWKQLRGID